MNKNLTNEQEEIIEEEALENHRNKKQAERLRYIRKIGNSYYIKLEPADLKDFCIIQNFEKIKINIDDIIIKFTKNRK